MFCSVLLKDSRRKITIPIKWVRNLDMVRIFNSGIGQKQLTKEPDFRLVLRKEFDGEDGCFMGRSLHTFGKLAISTLVTQFNCPFYNLFK